MVRYDTKLTNELCQTLSEVIDTAVSFYDENLAPQGHSKGINRGLCDAVRVNNLGVCLQTDKNTLKRFQGGESDFYYSSTCRTSWEVSFNFTLPHIYSE